MGLLRNRDDIPDGRRFRMQEKLASIGDDSWIEDEQGDRVYKVDGKALRLRDTMAIERDGHKLATVHKALVGIRDRFKIELEGGEDLKAHGNVLDHEYEIERDGDVVAAVSKKWFRVRDTYGIEIRRGEDEPLLLAVTVALDQMTQR
jgi:uncharacterized protein YxjI